MGLPLVWQLLLPKGSTMLNRVIPHTHHPPSSSSLKLTYSTASADDSSGRWQQRRTAAVGNNRSFGRWQQQTLRAKDNDSSFGGQQLWQTTALVDDRFSRWQQMTDIDEGRGAHVLWGVSDFLHKVCTGFYSVTTIVCKRHLYNTWRHVNTASWQQTCW